MKGGKGIVGAYITRGTILWVLSRLVFSMMGAIAGAPSTLSASTTIALFILIPLLMYFDIVRRGEIILVANLGFSLTHVLLISTAPALVGEALINILTAVV